LSTVNSYADSIRTGKTDAVAAAKEIADAVSATLSTANPTLRVQVASSSNSVPAPGHAKGTTNAEDVFIAGEEGPELIVGKSGSTVFPASETAKVVNAVSGLNDNFDSAGGFSVSNSYVQSSFNADDRFQYALAQSEQEKSTSIYIPAFEPETANAETNTGTDGVKKIILEIAGKGNLELTGGKVNEEELLAFLYEYLKPVLAEIVTQEVFEEGDSSYEY